MYPAGSFLWLLEKFARKYCGIVVILHHFLAFLRHLFLIFFSVQESTGGILFLVKKKLSVIIHEVLGISSTLFDFLSVQENMCILSLAQKKISAVIYVLGLHFFRRQTIALK